MATLRHVDGLAALKDEMGRRAGQTSYDVTEFLEPRVQVHGDAAVLFYRLLAATLASDGAVAHRKAWNCTEVYVKRDGRWRIVHTHWSLIGAQAPPEFASETD